MNQLFRPTSLAWLALVAVSALWIAGMTSRRISQIEQVSNQAPATATGQTGDSRTLLLPVGAAASQAWLLDAQKMLTDGTWRATRADYDNAPEGRAVHGDSPYRWWLRLVAQTGPAAPGHAVEHAALRADPALHILLCVGAGLFAAWRFGAVAGGFLAAGIAALFAHAQVFAPGQPDDHGLFLAANLAGLLLLLAGLRAERVRGWFLAAGAAGGFGLWLDAGSQLTVLAALFAGGLAASWFERGLSLPWRLWSLGGAAVALAGWLIEGRPGGLAGNNLGTNHPLLLIMWLGAAEVLARAQAWRQAGAARLSRFALAAGALALLAPLGWLVYRGGLGADFGPNSPALGGGSLLAWLRSDGLSFRVLAALLPVLLLPAAFWLGKKQPAARFGLLFAGTTALLLLLVGGCQLRWWGVVGVTLLGLLATVAPLTSGGFAAIGWRAGLGLLLLPGLIAAWPRVTSDQALAPAEARALVERDLAQWLAARSEPGAIVFAPPALAGSLAYYGGLRVVASPYPGNEEGLALAARIAAVTSTDEAQALIQRRGIQYLVLPSWDDTLDRLAKAGSETPERSLVALLRQWLPPRWLRPVPYQLPVIPGLEQDTLAVFELVEPQENVLALSRLAEYFVETGQLDMAAAVGDSLAQAFATDAGAMIARAKVALARNEARTITRLMPELLPAVADGKDEDLPWERRANLAIVFAQTKHPELARRQVEFCLEEADAERLRSLGPVSLFRFLTIARAFRMEFTDPRLRETAIRLLPVEFQEQLRQ